MLIQMLVQSKSPKLRNTEPERETPGPSVMQRTTDSQVVRSHPALSVRESIPEARAESQVRFNHTQCHMVMWHCHTWYRKGIKPSISFQNFPWFFIGSQCVCRSTWLRHTVGVVVMMTSSNGNIFRVTVPLCGEFTGHRWIPRTKVSGAGLWCFL